MEERKNKKFPLSKLEITIGSIGAIALFLSANHLDTKYQVMERIINYTQEGIEKILPYFT